MQVLAFLDHFGIADDDPRVNPWGGAIAVGHPLASSGVRLMTQLARQFAEHPEVRYGLTAMCVGIGMGGTVIWENPHWEGAASDALAVFENEVVTAGPGPVPASVPGLAGELALITLDNGFDHTKPNTLRPGGLASLDAAIDESRRSPPTRRSIAVTGKPFIFCVGADLTGMPLIADRGAGAGARPARAPGLRAGCKDSAVPDLRVRQRRGAWAAAWSWRCTATTARCPRRRRRSRCPRSPSAWCPAGAAPSCCRT